MAKPLPDAPITNKGPISHLLLEYNLTSLKEAIFYVQKLPYKRNSSRYNYTLVLPEQCGTCSTKHALIKALADELQVPVYLCFGIFIMNARNMPSISEALRAYDLPAIPEAHCYLMYEGQRFDLSFPEQLTFPKATAFQDEHLITVDQIVDFKDAIHHNFIEQWRIEHSITTSMEHIWACREACIAALGNKTTRPRQ